MSVYMKIDDIKGDVSAKGHQNKIQCHFTAIFIVAGTLIHNEKNNMESELKNRTHLHASKYYV